MADSRRVLLMLGCSRASERGMLRGVVNYCRFHSPWVLYREPPFYRKPPYHGQLRPARTRTRLRDQGFDGVITFAANEAQLRTIVPQGFPAVVLPIEEKIPGCCCIMERVSTVGRMGAEHFLDRGFARFAFCGYDHMFWSRIRQDGFVRRVVQAGFTVCVYEPPRPSNRVTWEAEQTSMAAWLRSLPKPAGLMVCNDDRAQQAVEAIKASQIRVPDEIAILGVDDDDMICELTHPPLSSIAMNFEQAGYEAAAQLDRQMAGDAARKDIHLRPTHVHTRQSTDVLAVEDPIVAKALRFIRTHVGSVVSVDDVVEATSTSRRLLERHFKEVVGATVYREIQRTHVERACRMLAETNWSLTEIAQRCGFSNPVHFSIAFKRHMRMTPQQHRRTAVKS
ncbi:MAG: substrate-binding domain-containing protein [Solirubrobacterales bacterium]